MSSAGPYEQAATPAEGVAGKSKESSWSATHDNRTDIVDGHDADGDERVDDHSDVGFAYSGIKDVDNLDVGKDRSNVSRSMS